MEPVSAYVEIIQCILMEDARSPVEMGKNGQGTIVSASPIMKEWLQISVPLCVVEIR